MNESNSDILITDMRSRSDWTPLAAASGRIDLDTGELTLVSGNMA